MEVRRASSLWRHYSRLIRGVQVRYCLSCGHRWRPGSLFELSSSEHVSRPLPLTLRWAAATLISSGLVVWLLMAART
ncbi:MAG: hypothetical protein ABIJ96_08475 [Elusimicrobiota bacterium]